MNGALSKVKESRKGIVEQLIENMNKGYILSKEKWDKNIFRPINMNNDISYKGGNRLRLMLAASINGYNDNRWLTFKQAQSKGYKLKKGEKGTLCEKWIFDKEIKQINQDTGKEEKIIVELNVPMVNYFYLFNGEQFENAPKIETIDKVFNVNLNKIANDLMISSECSIYELRQDSAFYSPSEDKIVLPQREIFKDENSFISTLVHEMSHSTGHESRLNRDLANKFGSIEYAKEELVAELSSIFVSADIGLDEKEEHFNDHSNYIKSWSSILTNDTDELFRACSKAEKASERIVKNYNKLLEIKQSKTHENKPEKKRGIVL